jgi:hypothetical protein
MGYAQCVLHKKRLYPDEARAIHAAIASSKAFGKSFRVYDCDDPNGGFHITSQAKLAEDMVTDGV